MGDVHVVIVHDAGEVVRGEAVALDDDEIAPQFRRVERDPTANHVFDHQRLIHRQGKADRDRLALGPCLLDILLRRKLRRPGIDEALLLRLGLRSHGVQLLGRLEAIVRLAGVKQLPHVTVVEIEALRLKIRPVRPAYLRPFIPFDAQPAEILHHLLRRRRRIPFEVGILDPQHERAARAAGPQPIEQRSPSPADVQIPRRRRRKPCYHFFRHCLELLVCNPMEIIKLSDLMAVVKRRPQFQKGGPKKARSCLPRKQKGARRSPRRAPDTLDFSVSLRSFLSASQRRHARPA